MTHPTTIALLAADRHAELLREAAVRRRADHARTSRRAPRPVSTVPARVRTVLAAFRRPSSAQVCCA